MSSRRILGITIFSVLFIGVFVTLMYLTSLFSRDSGVIPLPQASEPVPTSDAVGIDALDRVEITRENVIDVVAQTLSRLESYSRIVMVVTFWDDGQAHYIINVNISGGITSLSIQPPITVPAAMSEGVEKRIITTPDLQYIWYSGDSAPFVGAYASQGNVHEAADTWQMLVTYESILTLDKTQISDAGYAEFSGDDCIYIEYITPALGYTGRCYVSIGLGLVIAAQEFDETGALVYSMTAGECKVGIVDLDAFTLPDGTVLIELP